MRTKANDPIVRQPQVATYTKRWHASVSEIGTIKLVLVICLQLNSIRAFRIIQRRLQSIDLKECVMDHDVQIVSIILQRKAAHHLGSSPV